MTCLPSGTGKRLTIKCTTQSLVSKAVVEVRLISRHRVVESFTREGERIGRVLRLASRHLAAGRYTLVVRVVSRGHLRQLTRTTIRVR